MDSVARSRKDPGRRPRRRSDGGVEAVAPGKAGARQKERLGNI
jgi:hypothetical protein